MNSFLKAKTAGLPRWAWVALAGGGIALGLYLRHRSTAAAAEAGTTEEGEGEYPENPPVGEAYAGEGGLGGAGLYGSPAGSTLSPVETPYVPEGFTKTLESQNTTISDLFGYIKEHPAENNTVEIIREGGGGGAPEAGNHEVIPTPTTPAAKSPQCSAADISALKKANAEISRLQGRAQNIQSAIQSAPKNQKAARQAELTKVQAEIQSWHDKAQAVRNKPACASVQA
jgi:uncharacterized protein YdcH (DUF465 family)